jgi:hypothetical protein
MYYLYIFWFRPRAQKVSVNSTKRLTVAVMYVCLSQVLIILPNTTIQI